MVFAVVGLLALYIVGPILALVFAGKAKRHLQEEPGRPGGELAASAKTIAIVALLLQVVIGLLALLFALIVGVSVKDAGTREIGPIVTPSGAEGAFSSLCKDDLHGDSGGCGCALSGVREQGITDAMLALDVTEYRATQIVPEEIAVALRNCGVLKN